MNKTIHELNSLSQAEGTDELIIYDVSEGESKKIQVQNLIGNPYYSTDETFTGQYWIDGKPIYRKVFDNGSYVSNLDINVSSLNIDTLIKIDAIGNDNTSGTGNKWLLGETSNRDIYIRVSDNHLVTSGSLYKRYAILEYTKTTE